MTDILTLTLNPALDLATFVPEVVAGPKLRCSDPQVDPGGGGINVSRAVRLLGGSSRAFVAFGGATGARLAALLAAQGIDTLPFDAPGETRESLTVTESGSGRQFRFVLPGAVWPAGLADAALLRVLQAAPRNGIVVLSGSLPPGVPDDFPRHLSSLLGVRTRVVADTSGAPLAQLAGGPVAGLDVLRMDHEEAEALAGLPLRARSDTADFAAGLVARGVARMVIVARGADGSVLVTGKERLFAEAAKVPVKSKVGAGDSFVGGFVLALAQGATNGQALARGVAAASAAVMTEATELCRREDAERLLPHCVVSLL